MLSVDNFPCRVASYDGYQLSAFLLASHHRDVTRKHVGEGFKRLIRRREFNPHDPRVIVFSRFRKYPQRS